MKKQVIYGWVGKTANELFHWNDLWDDSLHSNIYKTRGHTGEWATEDWPPRKVRVTVEEVKP